MPVLSIIVLTPIVAALVLLAIPGRYQMAIRYVSLIAATITLVFSIAVFISYYTSGDGSFKYTEQVEWLKAIGISYHLGVDGISAPMLILTGFVIFTGVIVSWNVTDRPKEFFILLMTLVGGVYGVFASLDMFFFFFFYEIAVLPMYLLIAVWGSTRKEYAAMKLTLFLVAGSVLIWVGMLGVVLASNLNSFDILALQNIVFSDDVQKLYFPFFLVGFGILAGLWPFHTWSPDGHVAAPTAVSMLHAGVLMKLGAYGVIRVGILLLPEGAKFWMPVVLCMASVNIIYGAFSAMAQKDLKFVIGYSSVSHMGYVMLGFASLSAVAINGAVLQMFSHGIMTALFFAIVGVVYYKSHTREIAVFEGLAKRMPLVAIFFSIAGLASLGLPGLSGFAAEFLVFVGTYERYPIFGIIAVLGVAITAAYILRLLAKVFFGPLDEKWVDLTDAGKKDIFAGSVLVSLMLVVGIYPWLLVGMINSSVEPIIKKVMGS